MRGYRSQYVIELISDRRKKRRKDEEGIQAVKALGQRMAWLLKKLYV